MKKFCMKECSVQYLGDDVRVPEILKRNGNRERHASMIFKSVRTGTTLVTMTSVVPARTWESHAAALAASERYKTKAQTANAAGKILTASLALFLEVKDMEVKNVLDYRQRGCMGKKLLEREEKWKIGGKSVDIHNDNQVSWQEYAEGWEALADNRWGI